MPVPAVSRCNAMCLNASLRRHVLALTVLAAVAGVRAHAQQVKPAAPGPAASTEGAVLAAERRGLRIAQGVETAPGATSPYALPTPEVTLQTTKAGTDATAVIGVANPFWGFRTTFKTPIGKEDDAEATPLSLSGLGNQASVDFAVIRRRMFRQSGPKRDINALRLAFCAKRRVPGPSRPPERQTDCRSCDCRSARSVHVSPGEDS